MRKNDTQMKKSELLPFHIIKACGDGSTAFPQKARRTYQRKS